jgi:pyruvate,orthophosphate dikinase
MTSHAAVVARGWGKTAITGCAALKVKAVSRVRPLLDTHMGFQVDDHAKTMEIGGKTLRTGDWISLNGNTGEVYFVPSR